MMAFPLGQSPSFVISVPKEEKIELSRGLISFDPLSPSGCISVVVRYTIVEWTRAGIYGVEGGGAESSQGDSPPAENGSEIKNGFSPSVLRFSLPNGEWKVMETQSALLHDNNRTMNLSDVRHIL